MSGIAFRCNVCGRSATIPAGSVHREGGHCPHCGATVRFRELVHALSIRLFGAALTIGEFPDAPRRVGLGLSDAACYATRLAARSAYTNYFYHAAPFLDITQVDPALHGTGDFVIASDVFEHVPPPRHVPFDNVARVLKPGGLLVFSVPYSRLPKTVEYFPHLFDFHVVTYHRERVLVNRRRDGRVELFDHLFWHGGDGWTLELRVFAKDDVLRLLRRAGFEDVRIHDQDVPSFGIFHPQQDHSFVITAVKQGPAPASAPTDDEEWLYPEDARVEHPQVHYPERVERVSAVDVVRALDGEARAGGRLARDLQALYASWSWRLTAPLRAVRARLRTFF